MGSIFQFLPRTTVMLLFIVGSIYGGAVFARAGAEGAPSQGGEPGNSPVRSFEEERSDSPVSGGISRFTSAFSICPGCTVVLIDLSQSVKTCSYQVRNDGIITVVMSPGGWSLNPRDDLTVTVQALSNLRATNNETSWATGINLAGPLSCN